MWKLISKVPERGILDDQKKSLINHIDLFAETIKPYVTKYIDQENNVDGHAIFKADLSKWTIHLTYLLFARLKKTFNLYNKCLFYSPRPVDHCLVLVFLNTISNHPEVGWMYVGYCLIVENSYHLENKWVY